MDLTHIATKVQSAFDWVQKQIEPIEHRWFIFLVSCVAIILFKAIGASGLALMTALFYIMYFVTLRS